MASDAAPPYELSFDAATATLRLTLRGFWTEATLAAFAAEMLAVTTRIRRDHAEFNMLSDSRSFAVQSATVSAGFTAMTTMASREHRGATAIVVASMMNKLQAERTMTSPRLRVFLDYDEAVAWLAEQRAA